MSGRASVVPGADPRHPETSATGVPKVNALTHALFISGEQGATGFMGMPGPSGGGGDPGIDGAKGQKGASGEPGECHCLSDNLMAPV